MSDKAEICLQCSLPLCDEKSRQCLYRITFSDRDKFEEQRRLQKQVRQLKARLNELNSRHNPNDLHPPGYYAEYYQKNREKKLAAAKAKYAARKRNGLNNSNSAV